MYILFKCRVFFTGVTEFLSKRRIPVDHPDFKGLAYKSSLKKLTNSDKLDIDHPFHLQCAYSQDIMPYTNFTLVPPVFLTVQSVYQLPLVIHFLVKVKLKRWSEWHNSVHNWLFLQTSCVRLAELLTFTIDYRCDNKLFLAVHPRLSSSNPNFSKPRSRKANSDFWS